MPSHPEHHCKFTILAIQKAFPGERNPLLALQATEPFVMLAALQPVAEGAQDDGKNHTIAKLLISLVRDKTGEQIAYEVMLLAVQKMRKFRWYEEKFTNGTKTNIMKEVLAIKNGLMLLILTYVFEDPKLAYGAIFGRTRICDFAHINFIEPIMEPLQQPMPTHSLQPVFLSLETFFRSLEATRQASGPNPTPPKKSKGGLSKVLQRLHERMQQAPPQAPMVVPVQPAMPLIAQPALPISMAPPPFLFSMAAPALHTHTPMQMVAGAALIPPVSISERAMKREAAGEDAPDGFGMYFLKRRRLDDLDEMKPQCIKDEVEDGDKKPAAIVQADDGISNLFANDDDEALFLSLFPPEKPHYQDGTKEEVVAKPPLNDGISDLFPNDDDWLLLEAGFPLLERKASWWIDEQELSFSTPDNTIEPFKELSKEEGDALIAEM